MDHNVIIHEVPTGADPQEVFVSKDSRFVYVAPEVGDFIHLVDADKGYVVDTLMVGARPRRFAATPDGKELWVSSELSGEVYIIDREKFTIAGRVEFLPPGVRKVDVMPVDLAITKDGKTAYVTLGYAAHIAQVDVQTRRCGVTSRSACVRQASRRPATKRRVMWPPAWLAQFTSLM